MHFFIRLLLLLSISLSAFSETIKNINITGNSSISRGTILNYLPFESGDEFSEEVLNISVKALYASGLFQDVFTSFSNGEFDIKVLENPTLKYIDLLGYSDGDVLSEENIPEIKKNFNMTIGQIFSEINFQKFKNVLLDLYDRNGYYNIKIDEKFEKDLSNRIGIELDIHEGEPARVSSLKISGNNFFDDEELLDSFEFGEPDFFLINFFTQKDIYNEFLFNAGLEKIQQKYLDKGFLDFQITKSNVEISENKENISINIEISEGERYLVNSINITGDKILFSKQELLDVINIKNGALFDRAHLIKNLKKIDRKYSDIGYADVRIDSNIDNNNNNKVDINITIEPNQRFYIRRITFKGNVVTQDDVLRREFLLNEGQIYSNTDIEESIKRIKRLGYFSKVEYEIIDVVPEEDQKDIFVSVEETKTGTISFGLSHSNASGSSVTAGIQQRNIFGTGNTFNGAFSNSEAVKELSFFFSDPYFNDQKQSLRYGFFSKSTDGTSLDVSSYILDEKGLTFGYSAPITNDDTFGADLRLSSINLQCGLLLSSAGYEQEECLSSDSKDLSLSLHLDKNTLNDFYFPTEGTLIKNNISLGLPLGDFKYVIANSTLQKNYPIDSSLTLQLSSKLDIGSGYGGDTLPFYKRFYAGGASSVRGFDFNSLGETYPNGVAKGGELAILTNASIISPLPFVKDSKNMRIGGFFDLGGISHDISTLETGNFRASTGIAFSWLTPIGPLGVYLASPLIKKSNDKTQAFSFNLGTTF